MLQITDQVVEGDFTSLEGLAFNPVRSATNPYDLLLVNDAGSSDEGSLVGLRLLGLNEIRFMVCLALVLRVSTRLQSIQMTILDGHPTVDLGFGLRQAILLCTD